MTVERTVAGHRVLRLLATGARSQVWLAAGDLVLKVLKPPVPVGQPGREAEALHRARGDHVVELLDVTLGPHGDVLVFPRLPRGSLAELLVVRTALDAGEAVTVLAPVAACVARMHASGVAHGALEPACVLFRRDGAPMLTGFGNAELFEPGLPEVQLERISGVAADRAALLDLADAVLVRTHGARARAAARLREALHAVPPDQLAGRMAGELFELAAARPVGFAADAPDAGGESRRVVPLGEPVVAEFADGRAPRLEVWLDRLLSTGPGAIVRDTARRRWASWPASKRRAVIGAGAAALALVVAITVVPGPATPVVESPVAPSAGPADHDLPDALPGDVGAIAGDDPVAALGELIARRDRCFRELSVLCLEGVDEAGSAALDADRGWIRALVDGGVAPPRPELSSARLVERLGDSALVEFGPHSDPASVLLLKGEAGWRIRDYLSAAGSGEPMS